MSYSFFNLSLDVEEAIISCCIVCHCAKAMTDIVAAAKTLLKLFAYLDALFCVSHRLQPGKLAVSFIIISVTQLFPRNESVSLKFFQQELT